MATTPGAGGPLEVGPDVVDLAVVPPGPIGPLQVEHRDAGGLGERLDVRPEPISDPLEQRRRRHGVAEVLCQERHDLPADLQGRDVGVAPDAVDALDVEGDVAFQQVIDVDYLGHGLPPEGSIGPPVRRMGGYVTGGLAWLGGPRLSSLVKCAYG